MPDITDLMVACDDLASSSGDAKLRRRQAAQLREGLARLADEVRDLRAQRESLESQVMTLANEEPSAPQGWENVVILLEGDDEDDDPDFEPAA